MTCRVDVIQHKDWVANCIDRIATPGSTRSEGRNHNGIMRENYQQNVFTRLSFMLYLPNKFIESISSLPDQSNLM